MVAKLCSRSHGQPDPGVRSAAMISMRAAMSRDGFMASVLPDETFGGDGGRQGAHRKTGGARRDRHRSAAAAGEPMIRIRDIMEYLRTARKALKIEGNARQRAGRRSHQGPLRPRSASRRTPARHGPADWRA